MIRQIETNGKRRNKPARRDSKFDGGRAFHLTPGKNHVTKAQKLFFRAPSFFRGRECFRKMDPYYFLVSTLYVSCIYLWASSPLVLLINAVNPFSLLHVPLYGILTVFLLLALNVRLCQRPASRYLLAGLIASAVAVVDEVQQFFIPSRVGSFTDVILDLGGISFAMLVFGHFSILRVFGRFRKFRKVPLPYYSA